MIRTKQIGTRLMSSGARPYVQEYDYTVTPTTYAYTTEANKELFDMFPLVTAKSLARRKERPKRVRMLQREFIDDSMYNPNYGYFSKAAEIFTLKNKFDVGKMGNIDSFLDQWALEYKKQQRASKTIASASATSASATARASASAATATSTAKTAGGVEIKVPEDEKKHLKRTRVSRQLWHTPSELFTPHYGQALARYIVDQHRQDNTDKLIIYETGAGNGTLMIDILDFLKSNHPDLYARTQYNIIEISSTLSLKQRAHGGGHSDRVNFHNASILDWKSTEENPCFVIALEVWDNMAHDVIRYDNTTGQPYQGYTIVNPNGDFTEVYSPKLDKLASDFLAARSQVGFKPDSRLGWHPLSQPPVWRNLVNAVLPFQGNLSPPEYIPTRFFQFLQTLKHHFPHHKLLASDFTYFPGRIRGYCSPVVQTFMEDIPVTVSTHMVLQGYFDIMFPTDFKLAQQLYNHLIGRSVQTAGHGEFLKRWIDKNESATNSGEVPMLSFYRNAAFLYS